MSDNFSDEEIIEAWNANAAPWSDAVRGKKIQSRNLVTDEAIVDAVMSRQPRSVLDIGCGEGWLVRALNAKGVECIGTDVVPELIESARGSGGGEFLVSSYEEIAAGKLDVQVDVVVANFSLIGKEAVDAVIARTPRLLLHDGALVIQTPHPVVAGGDMPYTDGWREGSWAGCGDNFAKPAPWYFRTIGTWVKLLNDSELQVAEVREPMHPETGKPASLILIATKKM
jgi:2-polyprenyl-3-methyl-5-hydroxy-6-metoxy-1,4-benzoquinol methylase